MRAFIRRVVNRIAGEPEDERERRKEAAKQKRQLECIGCGSSDHATADCHSIIRPGETGNTWRSAGNANWSSGSAKPRRT